MRDVAMYYGIVDKWDDMFQPVAQIWREWAACFAEHGMQSLSCAWLRKHGMFRLYERAQKNGIDLQAIAERFGVLTEWQESQDPLSRCKSDLTAILEEHGASALRCTWLLENGHGGLYARMLRASYTLKDFGEEMQISLEYEPLTKQDIRQGFDEVFDKWGHIPPAPFLIQNGYATLAGNYNRLGFTIDEIRLWYGITNERRCHVGICWDSYAERALADFLTSCGVSIEKGRWYPSSFEAENGHKAKYDMHFVANQGDLCGRRIDVEVWGGPRHGGDMLVYNQKRKRKEDFHATSPCFVGIEYDHVFDLSRLAPLMATYIDTDAREPQQFEVQSYAGRTWSVLDGVLPTAVTVYKHLGLIPSQSWFQKKHKKYQGRKVEDWEPKGWDNFLHTARKQFGSLPNLRLAVQKVIDAEQ